MNVSRKYKESIMKILLTIREYSKQEGLSEVAVRKRVSSKYNKSIQIDKITYIIHEDNKVQRLKERLKNSFSKIKELKLKLVIKTEQNQDKYREEIERQNSIKDDKIKELEKDILTLRDNKDSMYERFLGEILKTNSIAHKKKKKS